MSTVRSKVNGLANTNTQEDQDVVDRLNIDDEAPIVNTAKNQKEDFSKSATAAKLSGTFHETAGLIKRKFGEFTDDAQLKKAGSDEQFLGKIHRLVGSIRSVREAAFKRLTKTRQETQSICIKHGGRMLDVAIDFVEDMKKALLK